MYYGKTEDIPKPIDLVAGPLNLKYHSGDIWNFKFGNTEIIQRIYANVRDQNWGTVPNEIHSEKIEEDDKSFSIRYEVNSIEREIDFYWHAEIVGDRNGKIRFSFTGEAKTTFLACRVGFCILHPLKLCMSKPCEIENNKNETHIGIFPINIAPAEIPPFIDMRAMAYEIEPGVKLKISFIGDLFEMEDQRNWSDASYKTFCTPLRLKFPRKIEKGTLISQTVNLELLISKPIKISAKRKKPIKKIDISLNGSPIKKIPGIGIAAASHQQKLSLLEVSRLKKINLSHIRIELKEIASTERALLVSKLNQAKILDLPVEIVLFLSDPEKELNILFSLIKTIGLDVLRWLIFEKGKYITTKDICLKAQKLITAFDSGAVIGGGSNADFYELNTGRIPHEYLDFVSFSLNPQVHSDDNDSLVSNLESLSMMVESASDLSDGKPVIISPITLKPRFNPSAITNELLRTDFANLPPEVDQRQMSLFGASWTIGVLSILLYSKISSLTFYETTGWRGLMDIEKVSNLSKEFISIPDGVFPIYHVFADIGEFRSGSLFNSFSSDPKNISCFGMRKGNNIQLIVSNLSREKQCVFIHGINNKINLRWINEDTFEKMMVSPEDFRLGETHEIAPGDSTLSLEFLPFSIARLLFVKEAL